MSNLDPACDIEVQGQRLHARADCTRLLDLGAPMKKAHDRVIRLAPRLAIEPNEIDWLVDHVGTAE